MALLGTILLWTFAFFGMVFMVGVVYAWVSPTEKPAKVEDPKVQPQITNLRPVAQPVPNQPQVLSKTTMQITTTKYLDSTEGKKAVTDGR